VFIWSAQLAFNSCDLLHFLNYIHTKSKEAKTLYISAILRSSCKVNFIYRHIKSFVDWVHIFTGMVVSKLLSADLNCFLFWYRKKVCTFCIYINCSETEQLLSDQIFCFQGGVTKAGLRHNITVGIMFIEAWLRGMYCSKLLWFKLTLNITDPKYSFKLILVKPAFSTRWLDFFFYNEYKTISSEPFNSLIVSLL